MDLQSGGEDESASTQTIISDALICKITDKSGPIWPFSLFWIKRNTPLRSTPPYSSYSNNIYFNLREPESKLIEEML